jgi:hypothetical protein
VADAWSDISRSTDPELDNVRRADPQHALDFRRGRDFQGRYLFTLDGTCVRPEKREPPLIEGIDIGVAFGAADAFRLRMALIDRADVDLFQALTVDLMTFTRHLQSSNSQQGLSLVIDRLGRWQRLFRKRRDAVLSPSEALGLAGELLFMRDCLMTRLPVYDAVGSWRGPYGDEQDFVINGTIFEVKTQLSTSDARLLISSENQLDTVSGEIAIVHQRLSTSASSAASSFTLNQIVAELQSSVGESGTARDAFDIGLSEAGYTECSAYDGVAWQLTERLFLLVGPDFPCLRPSNLPPGISNVRYMVSLRACQSFTTDGATLLDRVING